MLFVRLLFLALAIVALAACSKPNTPVSYGLWTEAEFTSSVKECGLNLNDAQLDRYCSCFYKTLSNRWPYSTYKEDTEKYELELTDDGTSAKCLVEAQS